MYLINMRDSTHFVMMHDTNFLRTALMNLGFVQFKIACIISYILFMRSLDTFRRDIIAPVYNLDLRSIHELRQVFFVI